MKKIFLAIGIMFYLVSHVYALEVETHKAINTYIAEKTLNGFSLDLYLKDQSKLLPSGKEENLNSKKVWEWLRDGGEYEDLPAWYLPYLRSVNHFHNPLTEAGFSGFFGGMLLYGISSTQWALLPLNTQTPCGYYSWLDVRDYYYKALTSSTKTERGTYFAQTFRGLGQLMHLIQDVSVPAHTRNDGHLFYNYENYAESYVNTYGVPTPTASTFFNGTISSIASLIDTNQYNGTNPPSGNAVGLAEYTNANFFSEDTINASNFPYPDITKTTITEKTAPSGTYQRQYYLKNCCGEIKMGGSIG